MNNDISEKFLSIKYQSIYLSLSGELTFEYEEFRSNCGTSQLQCDYYIAET